MRTSSVSVMNRRKGGECLSNSRNDVCRKVDIKRHMKHKWRQETFNKKLKLEKWEEKRQKAVLHKYYKQLRKDNPGKNYIHPADKRRKQIQRKADAATVIVPQCSDRLSSDISLKKLKESAFKQALQTFEMKRREKEAKIKMAEQQLSVKQERLKQYRRQRTENFKKLSMKTASGQPVMAGHIHILLNKIEKNLSRTTF